MKRVIDVGFARVAAVTAGWQVVRKAVVGRRRLAARHLRRLTRWGPVGLKEPDPGAVGRLGLFILAAGYGWIPVLVLADDPMRVASFLMAAWIAAVPAVLQCGRGLP